MKIGAQIVLVLITISLCKSLSKHKQVLKKVNKKQKQLDELTDYLQHSSHFNLQPSNSDKRVLVKEYDNPHYMPTMLKRGGPPSAKSLSNVYGLEADDNPYGPQPKLIYTSTYLGNKGFIQHQLAQLATQNMTYDQMQRYLDRVKNEPSSGLFSKKTDAHLIHQQTGCQIKDVQGYELCFQLKDCGLCTVAKGCGWCQLSSQCLPGTLTSPACSSSCQHKWIFQQNLCPTNILNQNIMGAIHAVDGYNLVTPEMAEPKLKVNSILRFPTVVHTPVILGDKMYYKRKETKLMTGESLTNQKYRKDPIYGTLHQVVEVEVPHTQYINVDTGKKMQDHKDQPKVTHGFDITELSPNAQ